MAIKVTRFDSLDELNAFLEQYRRWRVADVVVQIVTIQHGDSGDSVERYYLTHSDELTDQQIEAEREEEARRTAEVLDPGTEDPNESAASILDRLLDDAAKRAEALWPTL